MKAGSFMRHLRPKGKPRALSDLWTFLLFSPRYFLRKKNKDNRNHLFVLWDKNINSFFFLDLQSTSGPGFVSAALREATATLR